MLVPDSADGLNQNPFLLFTPEATPRADWKNDGNQPFFDFEGEGVGEDGNSLSGGSSSDA